MTHPSQPPDVIVAAARACFREYGPHRTRMEDVADRAGMSRQHLYRLATSRNVLIEAVFIARCDEIIAELDAGTVVDEAGVREAFTNYFNRVIDLGRNDSEFISLADAMPRIRLNAILTGVRSPIHEMARKSLAPLLAVAREQDLLRPDVDEDSIVAWIQGVVTLRTPQEHLGDHMQQHFISSFVLPSILVDR